MEKLNCTISCLWSSGQKILCQAIGQHPYLNATCVVISLRPHKELSSLVKLFVNLVHKFYIYLTYTGSRDSKFYSFCSLRIYLVYYLISDILAIFKHAFILLTVFTLAVSHISDKVKRELSSRPGHF